MPSPIFSQMSPMLGRRALLKASAAMAGVSLAGVVPAYAADETPQYGGTMRAAFYLFAGSLDPVRGVSGGDPYYWRPMFDVLIDADRAQNPRPETSLAESWDLSDPKAVTLQLRKGVLFHDGTPFNAEAVKFNIERILDPATKATPRAAFSAIDRVEVLGEHAVRLHLNRPWGTALSMLSNNGGAMSSPTAVKASGADYLFKPVGTGPFKLAEMVSGSHVRMVRNENYWGRDRAGNRLPYLDEIVVKLIPDLSVQVAALKAGELDLVYLPYRDVQAFEGNKAWNINVFEGSGVDYMLQFNIAKPPLDNVNLRLAVAHAINPEAMNKALLFNRGIIAKSGMWMPGSIAYDPTVARPSYNLAKARDYMRLGGKPNGFEIDVISQPTELLRGGSEILVAQLGAIGIKVNLKVYEVSVATERFNFNKEAPLYLTNWSAAPEPDVFASIMYRASGYYNAAKYRDARVEALLDAGAATIDPAKRRPIYRQVDEIVLGEAWITPLVYRVTYACAPAKVMGIADVLDFNGRMALSRLWLKKA